MAKSDIEVLKRDGVTIAMLGIEYDNLEPAALEAASEHLLELAQEIDPPLLVIDMSRTTFFGSSFLGTLFRVWRRLATRSGKMSSCCAKDVVGEVLSVTQVEKLWSVHADQASAIAAVKTAEK